MLLRVRSLTMSRDRPRRNRRIGEKLVLAAIGIATGIGFIATFTLGYAVWRLDQVQRFEVHDVLTAPAQEPITASDLINLRPVNAENEGQNSGDTEVTIIVPPTIG